LQKKEAYMRGCIVALILSLFLFVSAAPAAVTVVIVGSGTTSNASPSSGEAFTLTASGTVLFKVYADTSTDIGRITLTGTGTASLLIGSSGGFPGSQSTGFTPPALSRDWSGLTLSSFSGAVRVAGAVGRDLTGSITTDQVYRLEVGNDVEDMITATDVDNSDDGTFAVGPVIVGHSITSSGGVSATATPGGGQSLTIRDIEAGVVTTTGSDLGGTVSAAHGTILKIISPKTMSASLTAARLGNTYNPAIEVGNGLFACRGHWIDDVHRRRRRQHSRQQPE
jgi:hypothetical protein